MTQQPKFYGSKLSAEQIQAANEEAKQALAEKKAQKSVEERMAEIEARMLRANLKK